MQIIDIAADGSVTLRLTPAEILDIRTDLDTAYADTDATTRFAQLLANLPVHRNTDRRRRRRNATT